MQAEMRFHSTEEGQAVISLSVPAAKGRMVADAIKGVLAFTGHKVRRINEDGEEVVSVAEVFPDGNPAMALRGLRGKEDITQTELAERLGISQNMVSGMESGKRNISLKMAKRIAETFGVPYKLFV